jgi:hypothetical protein
MKESANMEERHVLITTQYRGVYFGTLVEHDQKERTCVLKDARMCLYWDADTNGVDGLASRGPNSRCKVGSPAPKIWLPGLTSLVDCTPAAVKAWRDR